MENEKVKKVFRSRISVLLLLFLLVVFVPCSIPTIKYMKIPNLYILGGLLLFISFVFSGLRYIISKNKLYLKIWIIPIGSASIADIISVERSYNPISSPSASLKRLCIRFKKGVTYSNWATWQSAPNWLLSPVREQEFLEELKNINPDINVKIFDKKKKCNFKDWDI